MSSSSSIPVKKGQFQRCFFCRLLIFFKINFFKKFFQEYNQRFQTVWIQIKPDDLLGLNWIQTVCKDYQQTTVNKTTICLLGCLLTFFKINFSKNYFRNTIRESNGLDQNQDRHSDLGPTCLQRLPADATSRQRVNKTND